MASTNNGGECSSGQLIHLRDPVDEESPKKIMKLSQPSDIKEESSGFSSEVSQELTNNSSHENDIKEESSGFSSEVSQELTNNSSHENENVAEGNIEDASPASPAMDQEDLDMLVSKLEAEYRGQWDDMEGLYAPHQVWSTFFTGWTKGQVQFYFISLVNGYFNENKKRCEECVHPYLRDNYNAKHFLTACELLKILKTEKRDTILKIIIDKIELAKENKKGYFGEGENWKILWYLSPPSSAYKWPSELNISHIKKPHFMAYSMFPNKKLLMLEISISWEYWLGKQEQNKNDEFMHVKKTLEKNGFEVTYKVIVLGARGVYINKLVHFFRDICDMEESEISNIHREISRKIIIVPYESQSYKDLKQIKN